MSGQTPIILQKQMQPETNPEFSKNNFSKIILFVILGLVIVVGIAFGAYTYGKKQVVPGTQISSTPTSVPTVTPVVDETASWKTYISKNKEYQIKYPPQNNYRECKGGVDFDLEKPSDCQMKDDRVYPFSIYEYKGTFNQFIGNSNDYYQVSKKEINLAGKSYQQAVQTLKKSSPQNMPGLYYQGTYTGFPIGKKVYIVIYKKNYQDSPDIQKTYDQILATFKFLDESVSTAVTPAKTTRVNGVELREIGYTLPYGWKAEIGKNALNEECLFFTPENGGGYLCVHVYNYPGTSGRREYYCQVTKVCIEGTTYFTEMNIGNISGYMANALDNSGGGLEYFGAKGNKFYVISSFSPTSPNNEFDKNYKNVLNSLVF